MKVVILCGGYGMRMREVTEQIPKPLAVVGGRPILLQIMKLYSKYGFDDFILPLGYRGDKIKEYFMNYDWMQNDFILDFNGNENKIFLMKKPEKWRITFVDTGVDTMTGGRIKRIQPFIGDDTFLLTYGDGLCDVNIGELLKYHQNMGVIATLTGIQKKSQYGILKIKDGLATSFGEKSEIEGQINGGFFVFNKAVFDYLSGDKCVLEREPLAKLASEGQLAVYEHKGFWQAVDTSKDLQDMDTNWGTIESILGIS
ncbi:MAG TPA: sugar phosphate nucleotidyltransferase [Clostridia bacterium]|nr:sugar phosphate nucleotidyltransferase [Clostridia bacterium]